MESRIKVFGHALHPMLVVFPLGLLIMGTFFDIAGLISGYWQWHQAAFMMVGAGVGMGILAAIPGIIDWIAIPMGTRAKTIGLWHGLTNVAVIMLYGIAWLLRNAQPSPLEPGWMPIALQVIAMGMGGVGAWLGGELVGRLGVGIDKGANLNAPSSLASKIITNVATPELATQIPTGSVRP